MKRFVENLFGARRATRPASRAPDRRPQGNRMTVEQLPDGILQALSVSFVGGVLTISGDHIGFVDNSITLTTGAGASIWVNAQAYGTVFNTTEIRVYGLDGKDTIDLSGLTSFGGAVTLDGGAGNDTIFGSPGKDTILGGAGIDDLYGLGGHDTLDGGASTASGGNFLFGGAGNDTLLYYSPDYRHHSGHFDGGDGIDTLSPAVVSSTGVTFEIGGTNGGFLDDRQGFSAENLIGSRGSDRFVFTTWEEDGFGSYRGSLSGSINGGGGSDFLDYSQLSDSAFVDLMAGTATWVAGGVLNIQNVLGSQNADFLYGNAENNVLVGNGGGDWLFGRDGRDVLIGGAGADHLYGGSGEDILIGARTVYDGDVAKLASLRKSWGGSATFPFRQLHINLYSSTPLNAAQIINDYASDDLYGGLDDDWIISTSADSVSQ